MLQRYIFPLLAIAAGAFAAWQYGWVGVAFVVTALIMWVLLHLNRLFAVMKRAADRPQGFVGSAVMLNAKLRRKVGLMHVIAMTQSIGEALTPEGEQPEIFRWTDGTNSSVTCEFMNGRLVKWTLHRPQEEEAPPAPAP